MALDGAEIGVRHGSVHALLGENGAGKTTLMRIAYGLLRPDAGSVTVEGVERRFASPADAIRAGIGMVQQHFALVPAMTVAENVALGGHGRFDAEITAADVRSIADSMGLSVDPQALVADLSVEGQQRVEIVKALARDARILILDEPTAVLAPPSADRLLAWLRQFADRGHAVVLITHKLREALRVADDVTVLRHGRTVLAAAARTTSDSALARAMLGAAAAGSESPLIGDNAMESGATHRPSSRYPRADDVGAPIILEHVTVTDRRGVVKIRDASFRVQAGEIVGIAAVEGEGQHELLRAIAGRTSVSQGHIITPLAVGFIPEDRQQDALILDFTLSENVALQGAGARRGRVLWAEQRARTQRLLATYDVRAADEGVRAGTLSGGNQQKLVLARELESDPSSQDPIVVGQPAAHDRPAPRLTALVAENPTRGLDIQATAAVHARLRDARDRGMALVVYSSDLDEVLALADRVLVLAGGSAREVAGDRDVVGRAMLGL
jgi:ABC-type uncharacterized transport system ATPase subunit